MTLVQWLWLVLLSVLWGGSFFFVGVAVREVPTLTLVAARVGLAALVLVPLVLALGYRLPMTVAGWRPFVVMALLNNVIPFLAIVTGQTRIASGLAAVLNATTPLWAVLLAHVLSDEKLTVSKAAGVASGLVGVGVLIGPAAFAGQGASALGMALVLVAAFSYGLSGVWGRRLEGISPFVTAAAQLIASSALLVPLALVVDRPWSQALPSASALAAITALAVVSTAVAYLIFFHIMRVSGPTNAMLVTLLVPVSALALGTQVLGETLLARHFAGAAIIAVALILIDGRLPRRLSRAVATPATPPLR